MRKTIHVISISGGKDSAATLLLALKRCKAGSVVLIFCDTGNEHEEVYNYLAYLEQALEISIVRLKADFSDQIAAKRRFIANDQRQIAARFPGSLEEKSRWEMLVGQASKRGFSTFFNKELHGGYSSDRRIMAANRIEAVVHWAHTSRGGRQLDMLATIADPVACSSAYGLCEP